MSVDKMSVDKISVDQMSVDKMSVEKMAIYEFLSKYNNKQKHNFPTICQQLQVQFIQISRQELTRIC
jgi:hypothetical protein